MDPLLGLTKPSRSYQSSTSSADSVFENVEADIEIEAGDVDEGQISEWARQAPVYALVSLAQDVELNVRSKPEVPADD